MWAAIVKHAPQALWLNYAPSRGGERSDTCLSVLGQTKHMKWVNGLEQLTSGPDAYSKLGSLRTYVRDRVASGLSWTLLHGTCRKSVHCGR